MNNPLSVVFGYAQMMQGKSDDPVLAERIELICQSAERAGKIVKTFLAMARQRPTQIEDCALNAVIQTAVEVSGYTLKADVITVTCDFAADLPPVAGDFDQLAQVFSNLIINAGHALQHRPTEAQITLRSRYDPVQNQIIAEVQDNGHGIPHDIRARIFDPFFSTKDVGQGTGIGLAFSHKIIASHDGELTLKPTQTGACFQVRLPAMPADHAPGSKTAVLTKPEQTIRVLVVDDETSIGQLLCDFLTEAGYEPHAVSSPREAIDIALHQNFDIVLSDFKMPEMDGSEFYLVLCKATPRYRDRVGVITGDALSAKVRSFLEETSCPFIEKPILQNELLTMVAELAPKDR